MSESTYIPKDFESSSIRSGCSGVTAMSRESGFYVLTTTTGVEEPIYLNRASRFTYGTSKPKLVRGKTAEFSQISHSTVPQLFEKLEYKYSCKNADKDSMKDVEFLVNHLLLRGLIDEKVDSKAGTASST
jgi:hypothetical protein